MACLIAAASCGVLFSEVTVDRSENVAPLTVVEAQRGSMTRPGLLVSTNAMSEIRVVPA